MWVMGAWQQGNVWDFLNGDKTNYMGGKKTQYWFINKKNK